MFASAFPLLLLGFSLGMRHATDADHVIAVATVVSRVRSLGTALMIGAMWGVGHTLTLMVIGGAILLFGLVVPPHVGLAMELTVALMLIGLGVFHLARLYRAVRRGEPPAHDVAPVKHVAHHDGHRHDLGWADRVFGGSRVYASLRPLLIGVVHGLAGSAAVALLVLTTVRDPRWGIGYIALFGVGTIAGMTLITGVLALPFAYARARTSGIHNAFGAAASLLSVGFGLFLAYDISFGSGLFTAHPQWTPG
ncbi:MULTISPECIES: high-affinity nickel-transport family protein [Sorangium]|uniref:High-affinity nickel-transport family protein n=1 Tax=Sorangium atrum TaxID=2995308 RepID=A0ABT5BV05_9BACT|nr:high-affinity nickel-transport family protein [Sorangium aterium]MDC0677985.1 high-affinity nickel-transport family protein [Sorangium aterium]